MEVKVHPPSFLTLALGAVSGELHVPTIDSSRKRLRSSVIENGWTPEPVWNFGRRDKSLAPAGNKNKIIISNTVIVVKVVQVVVE
jgi:hypothetical protein